MSQLASCFYVQLFTVIKVVDKNDEVTQTWGGSGPLDSGETVTADIMAFNDGDKLQIDYTHTDGLSLDSLKVNKCTDGSCQLINVETHEGNK